MGLGVGNAQRVSNHSEGSARKFRMRSAVSDSSTIDAVLAGELDMAAAFKLEPELERLLATPGVRALVLDLAAVGFIDSAGLGALLSIKDRATQLGIGFRIASASESVRRILELTGTRSVLYG
jgi:anti-anti-sigma factor